MAERHPRVLVVDDEPPILELVRSYLERDRFVVTCVDTGFAALEAARREPFDVIVLDVMLPGVDGIEVCRQVRTFSDAYVLMLTARSEEVDTLVGLAVGADDYLTKPFSPRELVARVRALLRRPRAVERGVAAIATGLRVDVPRRESAVDGQPVPLTRTEFDILAALAGDPGTVATRADLLRRVWGEGFDDDHLVDVHVANLRRKLGDDPERPRFIQTVRGVGYRLIDG